MKNSELTFQADEIKLKVVKLLKQFHELKQKHSNLEKETHSLKIIVENQKNTLSTLEERNKIIKLADSLSNSKEDIHELKKKVNEYIREIDECIRLLSDR
jgi:chromosome segregation ATPase